MMRKILLPTIASIAALPLGGAQASDGEGASDLAFVAMEPITVPIVDAGLVMGSLRFRIVLEAKDEEAVQALSDELPRLRAEALSAGSEFSRLSASPFMAVDARQLSDDLSKALGERKSGIARVLLVEVSARSV